MMPDRTVQDSPYKQGPNSGTYQVLYAIRAVATAVVARVMEYDAV